MPVTQPPLIVESFTGDCEFLSNFFPCKVKGTRNIVYPSSEHAYQAAKFLETKTRMAIAALPEARDAKKAGRASGCRRGWDSIKIGIMTRIVEAKFRQNPDLAEKLMSLEGYLLIEGNWWGDTFWGWCHGVGENHLGKILMWVRDTLIAETKRKSKSKKLNRRSQ